MPTWDLGYEMNMSYPSCGLPSAKNGSLAWESYPGAEKEMYNIELQEGRCILTRRSDASSSLEQRGLRKDAAAHECLTRRPCYLGWTAVSLYALD